MIVAEIIQRVQSLYSKGVESSDSRLMRRHIYNKMLTVRALLFYNKINKRQFISKYNYSILPCVELISVSGNDCPCDVSTGCEVLRTKEKLPKPINNLNGYIIDSVMSIDGKIIFNEVTYKSKIWRKGDKYSPNRPDYFIKDDYIYITSTRKLKVISIMGLFADPIEASLFATACDTDEENACPTYPLDMEFPIDSELVDALVELTVQELAVGFIPGHEDRRNDSQDKTETPQVRPQARTQAPTRRRRRNE